MGKNFNFIDSITFNRASGRIYNRLYRDNKCKIEHQDISPEEAYFENEQLRDADFIREDDDALKEEFERIKKLGGHVYEKW